MVEDLKYSQNAQNKIGWCSRGASLIRGERDHSH